MNVYLLPGMGATASMYGPEYRQIDNLILVDWPEYEDERSLGEVAQKVIRCYSIRDGDVVGGSSLGGMVAAEISKRVKLKNVFLIGSSLLPGNMNPLLKKASAYAHAAPVDRLRAIAKRAAVFSGAHFGTVLKMFSETDGSFMKAMCRAICDWDGCPAPRCTVFKIHGGKDRIIFPDNDSLIVKDAGHMLPMTHAIPVVNFIRSNLRMIRQASPEKTN